MQILTPEEKKLLRRALRAKKSGRIRMPDVSEAYRRFLAAYERDKASGRFPDPEATDAIVYGDDNRELPEANRSSGITDL